MKSKGTLQRLKFYSPHDCFTDSHIIFCSWDIASRDIEVIYIFIRRHPKNKAKLNLILVHKKHISRNYNIAQKRRWRQQISGFIKNLFISHFVKQYTSQMKVLKTIENIKYYFNKQLYFLENPLCVSIKVGKVSAAAKVRSLR